jgi:hypothetical protein
MPESENVMIFSPEGNDDFRICEFCATGIGVWFGESESVDVRRRPGAKCFVCGREDPEELYLKPMWLERNAALVHLCFECVQGFLGRCLDRVNEAQRKKKRNKRKPKPTIVPKRFETYPREWFGSFTRNDESGTDSEPGDTSCSVCGRTPDGRDPIVLKDAGADDPGIRLCLNCFLHARRIREIIKPGNVRNDRSACSFCGKRKGSSIAFPGRNNVEIRLCGKCFSFLRDPYSDDPPS